MNYKKPLSRQRYRFPCNRKNNRTSCQSIEKSDDEKYLELEKSGAGFEELELLTLGGLRKAVVEGCGEWQCHGRSECRHGQRSDELS